MAIRSKNPINIDNRKARGIGDIGESRGINDTVLRLPIPSAAKIPHRAAVEWSHYSPVDSVLKMDSREVVRLPEGK